MTKEAFEMTMGETLERLEALTAVVSRMLPTVEISHCITRGVKHDDKPSICLKSGIAAFAQKEGVIEKRLVSPGHLPDTLMFETAEGVIVNQFVDKEVAHDPV